MPQNQTNLQTKYYKLDTFSDSVDIYLNAININP